MPPRDSRPGRTRSLKSLILTSVFLLVCLGGFEAVVIIRSAGPPPPSVVARQGQAALEARRRAELLHVIDADDAALLVAEAERVNQRYRVRLLDAASVQGKTAKVTVDHENWNQISPLEQRSIFDATTEAWTSIYATHHDGEREGVALEFDDFAGNMLTRSSTGT